jgi:hypothetical protein
MYVRVVRFTDVSAERMEGLRARVEESDGPPPGVPSTGLKILYDGEQGTAVVLQHFATAEDMAAGARAFSAMDPADTPGTRHRGHVRGQARGRGFLTLGAAPFACSESAGAIPLSALCARRSSRR